MWCCQQGIAQLRKALPEIVSQQVQWDECFIRLLCELSEELQGLDERVARHDRQASSSQHGMISG